jgi:hypothetical protein
MRFIRIVTAASMLFIAAPAAAQEWMHFVSREDGFSANYPGRPATEAISYPTEYRQTLPARVYRAADAMGRYSTTVVDYRGIEALHNASVARCQAAKGANFQDGDACQNDFRVDVAGAMDHAAWNFMKGEGVKITHYMWYFNEMVGGRLLQLTNPDQSRTYAVIHQHAGRLYIHQATVNRGSPEPILFMQSLGWVDEEGRSIRYRTFYTEGYGEWQFPHPVPPRMVRGNDPPAQ